jgi:hypothetical protein
MDTVAVMLKNFYETVLTAKDGSIQSMKTDGRNNLFVLGRLMTTG